jgi:hypothetical protein
MNMTNDELRKAKREWALAQSKKEKAAVADLIIEAVRSTQDRIRSDPGKWNKSYQLRGVRRLAAALADALAAKDAKFDMQQFLTDCGYGAR